MAGPLELKLCPVLSALQVCYDVLGCCGGKAATEQRRARARELAEAKRAKQEKEAPEAAAAKAAKRGPVPMDRIAGVRCQEPKRGDPQTAAGSTHDEKLAAHV